MFTTYMFAAVCKICGYYQLSIFASLFMTIGGIHMCPKCGTLVSRYRLSPEWGKPFYLHRAKVVGIWPFQKVIIMEKFDGC